MHMHTHGHQTMVTETSKKTNFKAHFVYNTFLLFSNSIHWYISLLTSYSGGLKHPSQEPPY